MRGSPGLPRHCWRGFQFPIRSIVAVQMARQATARCPLWVIRVGSATSASRRLSLR